MGRYFGIFCGILSAASYGTNPLFAVPLLRSGYGVDSMLFFRFFLAAVMLSPILVFFKEGFKISVGEASLLFILGALFAISSQTLFWSFTLMPAGIASTILFLYPIFTALIMGVFFHAHISFKTIAAIALSMGGILFLADLKGGGISLGGIVLVVLSALSYAIYIVMVKVTRLANIGGLKLTFYSLLFAAVCMALKFVFESSAPQMPANASEIANVLALAALPTFVAITSIAYAIRYAGPTIAAVLGAFEPATAVVLCVVFLDEPFTVSIACGISLIIAAVVILTLPDRPASTKIRS